MDAALDIFRIAHAYVEKEETLDSIEEWLVPRLGEFLSNPQSTPSQLAALFELSSADVAAREADDDEIRSLVHDFLRTHENIQLVGDVATASSNSPVPFSGAYLSSTTFDFRPGGLRIRAGR